MIRYVTLVIDFSKAALSQDLRPSRAVVTKEMASKLLTEFADLNPLNKISVIGTMKQQAVMLSDFNQST
jgi:transcription initiation factor TFIIH subunit 2